MTFVNYPVSFAFIATLISFFLSTSNSNAQIGSLGGFNNIHLAEKGDLVFLVGKSVKESIRWSERYEIKSTINNIQIGYAFNNYLGAQVGYESFKKYMNPDIINCENENCNLIYNNHLFNIAFDLNKKIDLKSRLFAQNKKRNLKFFDNSNLLLNAHIAYVKNFNSNRAYSRDGTVFLWNSLIHLKFEQLYVQSNISLNYNFFGLGFSSLYGLANFNKVKTLGSLHINTNRFIGTLQEKKIHPIYGLNYHFWLGIRQLKVIYSIYNKYFIKKLSWHFVYEEYSDYKHTHKISIQLNLTALKSRI